MTNALKKSPSRSLERFIQSTGGITFIAAMLLVSISASGFAQEISNAWAGGYNGDPNNWNDPMNWDFTGQCGGQCVPNNVATFTTSNFTNVNIASTSTDINEIHFLPGAPAYTISVSAQNPALEILGAGVVNDSGTTQTFVASSGVLFFGSASAGDLVNYNVSGEVEFNDTSTADQATFFPTSPGGILFEDSSTAAQATVTGDGTGASVLFDSSDAGTAAFVLYGGPSVDLEQADDMGFQGSATADHASITANGGSANGDVGSAIYFSDTSTAANSVITVNGASISGAGGAFLNFGENGGAPTGGNATLIVNGGSNGGAGGMLQFTGDGTGGNARVELLSNSTMSVINDLPVVCSVGSLEGQGTIMIGNGGNSSNKITVGTNNLSTTFSGAIEDGPQGAKGAVVKTGSGALTLSGVNTYSGGMTITGGTLLVSNVTGSGTGTGAVQVNTGTLSGAGIISGAITVGKGRGTGAFLTPGTNGVGALTCQKKLTFKTGGAYDVTINSNTPSTTSTKAKGVTISSGVPFFAVDTGTITLRSGTVFTVLNNTARTPIAGTFSNLADGATITVGSNTYKANYEGGTGNDLTLTVQ